MCKQTEGCFNLNNKLKNAEQKNISLSKTLSSINEEIQSKIAIILQKKEIIDNLKRNLYNSLNY